MRDGKVLQSADFNFWGVTFRRDSNAFFATLRTGTATYLVAGDIAAKRMTVVYEGVECPSLSPDETRIAFKKLIGPVIWRAHRPEPLDAHGNGAVRDEER